MWRRTLGFTFMLINYCGNVWDVGGQWFVLLGCFLCVLYLCLFLLLVKFQVVYHKILMSVYMVVRSRPRRRKLFFITVYCCTNVLFLPDTSCPRIRWILVTCVPYYTFGPRDLTKCLTYVVSVLRQYKPRKRIARAEANIVMDKIIYFERFEPQTGFIISNL